MESTESIALNAIDEHFEEGLTEVDIERNHRVRKSKQNKKKPRPIIIKFVRYNCRYRENKEKLKNTGISITEGLTAKCMEMLNNANPVGIYLLKVNKRNTRTRCEICSKLTRRRSGVFIVNFEHI